MNKTLVIHPKDPTTAMLEEVYRGKGYDVIDDPDVGREELLEAIASHRRILMLGHGNQGGLLDPSFIKAYPRIRDERMFVLDDSFACLLHEKETLSVWCLSDQYFRRHRIPGFHTGMIISEMREEKMFFPSLPVSEAELERNITSFCRLLGECETLPPLEIKAYLLTRYRGEDPITAFNRRNLYVLDDENFQHEGSRTFL